MVEVYDPGTDRLGSKLSGGQGLPVHDSDQYPGTKALFPSHLPHFPDVVYFQFSHLGVLITSW